MIQKIRITRTDVRISQVFVEFQRLGSNPLSVFVITSVLCDFADVDFRIEVGSESLVVISGIAVYDVQVVDFIKMMFCCVCGIYSTYSRVESATQNGSQSGIFNAFLLCPLPAVFKVCLVFRLVVCCIQVVHSRLKTRFHNR